MVALKEVSSAKIQIANTARFGTYNLYLRKNLVNRLSLLKIKQISKQHGLKVTSADAYYIIL